jgi:transposase InsO family protein
MITRLHNDGYGIAELCDLFEVSRSGYYGHRHKAERPRRREDEALRVRISTVFLESRHTYGSPRVCQALRQDGRAPCRQRVARLMREAGLTPLQKRRFIPRTTIADPAATAAPNLLLELPPLTRCNQVWVSDITYIPTAEGWLYLAAVMDLHSRRILGWATAAHLRTELVSEALQRARFVRGGADLSATISHSDRGCQYTSADYRSELNMLGMQQSMSRTANCYDNATMESFWASLKAEAFRAIPATRAEARQHIHDYIDAFYNTRRLHSSLGYQSPLTFEKSVQTSIN